MPRTAKLTAEIRHAVECLKNPESIRATVNIYGEGTFYDQEGNVLLETDLEAARKILDRKMKTKRKKRQLVKG